ncbi:hypothetical protein ACP4OV_024344 [Aristida adscensionis]
MASSSSSARHQVTITLGRSGQVVKRRAISDIGNGDEVPVSGGKRPVRERLGSNAVDSDFYESQQRNKRRQIESNVLQHGDDGLGDDCQVGKGDLRLKLMRKGLPQRSNGVEQNGVDLREKLSRNPKNLPRYDPRGHAPESRSRYDMREKAPELRTRYPLRESVPESRPSVVLSRLPSGRSVDDLLKLGSSKTPYSSWAAEGSRHRSPDRLSRVRSDVTPQRTYDQNRSMPSVRSVGSTRAQNLSTRDTPDTLRTQQYACKSTISVDAVQTTNGITPSTAALSTGSVMKEVPLTVTGLLNSLGLEKYAVLFQAEEVDMAALRQMGESDLKDMGVPMGATEWPDESQEEKAQTQGPRKKILLAVGPQSKQRQR